MIAPTFTQGPWIVLARESRPGMAHEGYFRINGMTEDCEPEYHVATVIDANDLSQNEANARLIAAAPELFDALNALVNAVSPDDNDKSCEPYFRPALKAARTALAKAQGAQS